MTVTRLLLSICSDRMAETRDFYVGLLGFVVGNEHPGWYIQVASPIDPRLQFGIVRRDAKFTPKAFQRPAQGVIISAQVDDVDAVHAAVVKRGHQIAQRLRDEGFGMRHFMLVDPNGLIVNIMAFPRR
jgi:catechol 2,3-dioxygenase-like lactoylglutathione lyase family enzyme